MRTFVVALAIAGCCGSPSSGAGVAHAADVDLDLPLLDRARRTIPRPRAGAANRELHLRQTLDDAALGAYEMRMRRVVRVADRFEAPHVVADIGAAREARLGEIDEVAIDRRAIPPVRREPIRNIAV